MGLYRDLVKRIDELSFGFPKSYVGFDIALIKKIFNEEDARDFLRMAHGYQTAKKFARINDITEEDAQARLDRLAMKGLIFRRHLKPSATGVNPSSTGVNSSATVEGTSQEGERGGGYEYSAHPFVMGFLEWQAGRKDIDRSWLFYTSMYMVTSRWGKRLTQTMPFYRTVPQIPTMVQGAKVQPYDNVEELLAKHSRFAVGTCMCRLMGNNIPGRKCNHPLETCIETDDYATYYIETGIGREITQQEALDILRSGLKDGRIIQVTNSQEGENFCSCCGCGCGMLKMRDMYPGPANSIWTNHYAEVNIDNCIGCGACEKKCPFGHVKVDKKTKKAVVDTEKCLGCGLCVHACHKDAMVLRQKSQDKLYTPPPTYDDAVEIWEAETVKDYRHFK